MPSARQSVHHHILAVAMAAAFLVASIGIMGAATRMSGAIISQGSLVVESSVKKVQHPSGGVAKKLLVEDGARVAKDDLLILMDETVAQANLTAVTKSLWELEARRARLQAERDGDAEIVFPDSVASLSDPAAQAVVSGERRFFQLRKDANDGQKQQLKEQIAQNLKLDEQTTQLLQQIVLLQDQIDALRNGLTLADLGVDGIMTDRADVLADVFTTRGIWPQR